MPQAILSLRQDMPPGALKRKLAPGPAQYITTFQTFNEGRIALDPHYFYAYLQPELSEYDAWFNVKDGFLLRQH